MDMVHLGMCICNEAKLAAGLYADNNIQPVAHSALLSVKELGTPHILQILNMTTALVATSLSLV